MARTFMMMMMMMMVTDNRYINRGLDSGTIYIDTEGTFRPERVEQIARARSLDASHVLKSVTVCKVYNTHIWN